MVLINAFTFTGAFATISIRLLSFIPNTSEGISFNIFDCISRSVNFFKISSKSVIALKSISKKMFINGDEDQLNRVFINLIKNSEESIYEKNIKNPGFKGKIDIEINEDNDYIIVNLIDNGTGVSDTKKIMTPYFTTKKKGTGLGLPIVSKIINEHSGELLITNNINDGIDIKITFPKIHE